MANDFETPLQRANRLKQEGIEISPRVVKEWTYSELKDLSMNLGGLYHDAATLIAPLVKENVPIKEVAKRVAELTYELYLEKEELINKIKK